MSVNVGAAYMTVLPDMKGFGPQVRSQIDGQIGPSSRVARAASAHGTAAGKRYGDGFKHSLKGLAEGIGVIFAFEKGKEFFKESIAEATEARKANALTAAVLKSTGGVAGVSAEKVHELAESIQQKSAVDHEAVQSGENLLLTFKNVRNEAGKGNKIFSQGTRAAVDLAYGLSAANHSQVNLRSSTTLVGKALNDPIRGLTALRRVGVDFTKTQIDQIKGFVGSNHIMKAQKVILRELNSEFAGAAASQATPAERSKLAWKDLREEIGTKLLPEVDKLERFTATKLVPAIADFVHGMEDGHGAGGTFAKDLRAIYLVGKGVYDTFQKLPGPVKKYGIELLIATLVVRKFKTALAEASFTSFLTGLRNSETRAATLRRTIGTLAGAAGLVLLFSATAKTSGSVAELNKNTSQANDRLRFMKSAAGGAALGFSAFGPAGAVIGGVGGALYGVAQNSRAANAAAKAGIPKIRSYADSFKRLSGAATSATKDTIKYNLSQTQGVEAGRLLGVSETTLVNAILGRKKAIDKVNAAIREGTVLSANGTNAYTKAGTDAATALQAVINGRNDGGAGKKNGLAKDYRDATIQAQKQAAIVRATRSVVETFPKRIATRFEAGNIPKTEGAVARLAARYDLTRKQVKTLVTALGIPKARGQIDSIAARANALGKLHPIVTPRVDPKPAKTAFNSFLTSVSGHTVYVGMKLGSGQAKTQLGGKYDYGGGKAGGGRISANKFYVVGENGPEIFGPGQAGAITPNGRSKSALIDAAQAPAAGISLAGQRVAMTVTNWQEGTGHFEFIADSRVGAAAGMRGQAERGFGG